MFGWLRRKKEGTSPSLEERLDDEGIEAGDGLSPETHRLVDDDAGLSPETQGLVDEHPVSPETRRLVDE